MSDLDTHDSSNMSQVRVSPIQVYTQSPHGTRRSLSPQQETQFGADVEDVTPRNNKVLEHEKSEPLKSNIPTEHNISSYPLTRNDIPIQLERLGRDIQKDDDVKRRVELVSKQSRPFLMFKIVQCIFAAVLLPLNACTWPVMVVRGNIHLAMQPPLACVTFLIYCPVVFFGYLGDLHTPAFVMLLLDMLGGVYFTLAAIISGVYWADVEYLITQIQILGPPVQELEHIKDALQAIGLEGDIHLTADKLLMQCLLCSSAATMFIGDVFLTMKYLVLRRLPLDRKPLI